MENKRLRRLLTLVLVMVVGLFALTACGADETEEATPAVDEAGTVDEVEVEDIQEDDIDSETGEVIDEGEDVVEEDEDLLDDEDVGLGEEQAFDFNAYDLDGDTFLSEDEFGTFATEAGIDAGLFDTYDEDGDGLDQAEFNALREAQGLPIPEGDILPEDVETDDADVTEDDADVVEDDTDMIEDEAFDFADYDADADELIGQDEFGTFAAESGIDEGLFDTYDENDDLFLDENEFNTLLSDEGLEATAMGDQATTATRLLTTDRFIGMELVSGGQASGFAAYDLDADGFLDENEYNAYLTDFGMTDTGQFADYDADGDALLSEDEFNTFVQDEGLDVAGTDELAEVTLGTVVDGFFNIEGDMPYVVIDVEEEAVVQIETLVGDETLFDEEVDTILMSYNLLNVSTDADSDDEVATADIETPARLLLLDNFGQDIPWVAEEIDAAALESDQLFLDPARFNVEDEDFLTAGEQDLLQLSHFEFFDLADQEVVNAAGEDLGEIDELVVDIVDGRVAYAIVETGGFLGIGDNQTVIPWRQFEYETADQDFVLDVDAATLEAAPTITDEDLDTGIFDAEQWETDYNTFWDNEV